jgi:integrase
MTWLPWPVLAKKRWPAVEFKEKRGITLAEHLAIVAREQNPERKAFYKLAWHLGASQSDLAFLEAENVDWDNHVISYKRMKTDTVAIMRFDEDMAEILRDLPGSGPLFPYLRTVRAGDRATEFRQRCAGLKIKDVTLHSYRYAWADCFLICHPNFQAIPARTTAPTPRQAIKIAPAPSCARQRALWQPDWGTKKTPLNLLRSNGAWSNNRWVRSSD